MKRKKITCPECNWTFYTQDTNITLSQVGVKAKKDATGQFQYSVNMPQELMESGKFLNVKDELLLTGAFGSIFGATCSSIAIQFAPNHVDNVLLIGVCAGVTVAWGWLLAETGTRLSNTLPRFRQVLLDQKENWQTGANQVRDVDEIKLSVNISDSNEDRKISYFGTLPVDIKRFNEYISKVALGETLAINWWTGQGKLFTRKEYDQILILLKNGGLIINKGSNQGNVLSAAGQRAFKQHLKQYPPPY